MRKRFDAKEVFFFFLTVCLWEGKMWILLEPDPQVEFWINFMGSYSRQAPEILPR